MWLVHVVSSILEDGSPGNEDHGWNKNVNSDGLCSSEPALTRPEEQAQQYLCGELGRNQEGQEEHGQG